MKSHTNARSHHDESEHLTEESRSLLEATAEATEEKIVEARKRLAAALDMAKDAYGKVHDKAVAGAKYADKTIRDNPYQTMAVTFGVGALVGFLLSRRGK